MPFEKITVSTYETAKIILIKSIHQEKSIILFGSGSNGKTHLVREINDIIKDNKYKVFDGISNIISTHKSLYCINDLSEINEKKNKDNILIDMNSIKFN